MAASQSLLGGRAVRRRRRKFVGAPPIPLLLRSYFWEFSMTSSLRSLPSGRFRPPMIPCFSMLSFFFKFAVGPIPRSSSSPVIFALVFPFLFFPPFFLLLFFFEVSSPLSLYVASSSVVSFLHVYYR